MDRRKTRFKGGRHSRKELAKKVRITPSAKSERIRLFAEVTMYHALPKAPTTVIAESVLASLAFLFVSVFFASLPMNLEIVDSRVVDFFTWTNSSLLLVITGCLSGYIIFTKLHELHNGIRSSVLIVVLLGATYFSGNVIGQFLSLDFQLVQVDSTMQWLSRIAWPPSSLAIGVQVRVS